MKAFTSKIKSILTISIRSNDNFRSETKYQLEMLPRTCFLNKRILSLLVGYRNYLGQELVMNSSDIEFKKPAGDYIMKSFPKIMD